MPTTRRSGAAIGAALFVLALCPLLRAQFVEPTCVLRTFTGENAGDTFGWVSAPLADLDGDGVQEIVVTAPFHNASTGRIYVYSGGTGRELFRADGPGAGSQFGHSARDAGDVDGDGKTDVVVGARGTGSVPGRAIVLSGVDGSVLRTIQLGATTDQFGFSVAGAGDQNNDGFADVAVGAPNHDATAVDAGRVWIVSGANGTTVLATSDGRNRGHLYGTALGNVGDLNNDGEDELAIGAMGAGQRGEGRAYVFDAAANRRLFAMQPQATAFNMGRFFVGSPGDVNDDTVNDIYVCDFQDTTAGPNTGRAYVFDGTNGALIWSLAGSVSGEGFGIGRDIGDVDYDGAGDLILCGWSDSSGAPTAGKASIVSGRSGTVLRTFTSTTGGENFGFDAHGVGDVNRDGRDDYFVTAASFNGSTGRCYLLSGCDGEVTENGTGVAGAGGFEPTIELDSCPAIGRTPNFAIEQGRGGALGALALGATRNSIPLGAGTLLLDPQVVFAHALGGAAGVPGAGTARLGLRIPNRRTLIGARVHAQAFYLDSGAPFGLSMTSMLRVIAR